MSLIESYYHQKIFYAKRIEVNICYMNLYKHKMISKKETEYLFNSPHLRDLLDRPKNTNAIGR